MLKFPDERSCARRPGAGWWRALFMAVQLAIPASLLASSFVVPPDGVLARRAPVIAVVSVMSVSPSPAAGVPSTDYIVLVEELVKGRVSGSSIVVRVPGGIGPDGIGLAVDGAPQFREGDRALLFLRGREDGTYGIDQLALGAFRQGTVTVAGVPTFLAIRDALVVTGAERESTRVDSLRDWQGFLDWLRRRATGERPPAKYFRSEETALPPLPVSLEVLPIAWSEFSRGKKVLWTVDLGMARQRRLLRRAVSGWNRVPGSSVALRGVARDTEGSNPLGPDGVNEIHLADPTDFIPGSFRCTSGGVVAVSWVWYDSAVTFRLREGSSGVAARAMEADILFNDGAECFLRRSESAVTVVTVLTHEIGHTLGLDHSADPESSMFPIVLRRENPTDAGGRELALLESLYPRPEGDAPLPIDN